MWDCLADLEKRRSVSDSVFLVEKADLLKQLQAVLNHETGWKVYQRHGHKLGTWEAQRSHQGKHYTVHLGKVTCQADLERVKAKLKKFDL